MTTSNTNVATTAQAILDWAAGDGQSLLNALTSEVSSTLTNSERSMLTEWIEKIQYQGLNTLVMRAAIARALKTRYPNDDANATKNKLGKLIALGLHRGNNLKKLNDTLDQSVVGEINDLISAVNIKSNIKSDRKAITLVRVCLCFPEITMSVAGGTRYSGPTNVDPSYPPAMRTGAFSSMIPLQPNALISANTLAIIVRATEVYQAHLTAAISPSKVKPVVDLALIQGQSKYIQTAREQSAVSNERRLLWIAYEHFGILTKDGTPTPPVIRMATFNSAQPVYYPIAPAQQGIQGLPQQGSSNSQQQAGPSGSQQSGTTAGSKKKTGGTSGQPAQLEVGGQQLLPTAGVQSAAAQAPASDYSAASGSDQSTPSGSGPAGGSAAK